MEKARLDLIFRQLKIIKKESHHKLLLSMKNLHELGASPFPYIVFVLPCPLPSEVFEGKHFVLADLMKSLLGRSFQAEATPEPLVQPDHLPFAVHDPKPVPHASKRKKKKKTRQAKATDAAKLILPPQEWVHPSMDTVAPGPKGAREIIDS